MEEENWVTIMDFMTKKLGFIFFFNDLFYFEGDLRTN